MELTSKMRFEVGHHISLETCAVLNSRIFARLGIKIHKTAIQDQNYARRYEIYVMERYVVFNKAHFQGAYSLDIHKECKIIPPNAQARYLG